MAGIGARLCMIRRQWHLSLREVEERSRRIAQERNDSSYQVSASWLARLERYDHGFTVNKLLALAEIYSIPINELLTAASRGNVETQHPNQLTDPDASEWAIEGIRKVSAGRSRAYRPRPGVLPDGTTLLPTENAALHTPYLRGIIGRLDLTLSPMIPPGSIVQIDTSKRDISSKNTWTHEFQRPIYFLKTNDTYVCGWCELDRGRQWVTLIPHPLSSVPSRIWRYGTELENLGRVISIVIRLGG